MTFSDAEEDQPSSLQNREHVTENSTNLQPDNANEARAEGGMEILVQNSPSNTDISEPSSSSVTNSPLPILNGPIANGPYPVDNLQHASNSYPQHSKSNMNFPEVEEVLDENLISISVTAEPQNAEGLDTITSTVASESVNGTVPNSNEIVTNEAAACGNSIGDNDLESEKIKEKLEQIQGYIQQTANAMQALENEGNMDNIGKYDTLVKVMRDLKNSESKLNAHLNVLGEKSSKLVHQTGSHDSLYDQFEAVFNSLQIQENECTEALCKTLFTQQVTEAEISKSGRTKESGSESIGVVGSFNGDNSRPSLHERLNHHQHEQEILSARLRESLLRRQELMTRYQATRERLNNLKRKRLGITQEERSILQSAGASETPYEDPIPGADSWTLEQLESAVQDFIVLREKVDRVHQAYIVRLEAVEEGDSETPGELNAKIEQLLSKRFQIENALTQMRDLITAKRDGSDGEINNLSSEESNLNAEDGQLDSPTINVVNAQLLNERVATSVENLSANVGNRRHTPSEDSIPARESDGDVDIANGAQALTDEVEDLQAKQQHLHSLKQQLKAMKQLLFVTQEESCLSDSHLDQNETDFQNGSNAAFPEANDLRPMSENSMIEPRENLINSTVVGLNGTAVLHLSESEKRDPLVVSKYLQLAQAKERLAKMEEVMKLIAEAGDKGLPLDQVLSPENMAILTEAREEEDVMVVPPIVNVEEFSSISDSLFHDVQRNRQTRSQERGSPRNQVNENLDRPTNDQSEWERDRKISEMQFHLNKKTPGIPSINDGSRVEPEKGAEKKQARNLFCEGGNDPRVSELMALQEELKEKKNALEALMNKMGKSSSFTIDNISDNISENVSDGNSATAERQTASWGAFQGRSCTDLYHSEEVISRNVTDEIFNTSPLVITTSNSRQGPEVSASFQQPVTQKNQNPLNLKAAKSQFNSDNQQYSVNNLNGSLPRSVRPKHNINGMGNGLPTGLWEGAGANNSNTLINQDPNTKVQNTVSAALSQLSQVQETINSLYDELRGAEREVRQPSIPSLINQSINSFGNNVDTSSLPQQLPYNINLQNGSPSFSAASPSMNSQGLGDSGATNHLIAGLQQCFSQLYLHSLEIQSLNKHLQVRPQPSYPQPQYPFYPFHSYFYPPPPPPPPF